MGLCCCKLCDDETFPIDDRNVGNQGRVRTGSTTITYPTHVEVPPRPAQRPITTQPTNQNVGPLAINSTSYQIPQPHQKRTAPQPPIVHQPSSTNNVSLVAQSEEIVVNNHMVLDILRKLSVRHHTLYIPPKIPCVLEPLDSKSETFLRMKLFRHKKFNENYRIYQAMRVWNPYLMAQYVLNKKKYEKTYKEHHMFHGTSQLSAQGIIVYNFDWRLTKEHWYGKGVYFAWNPYYAALFSMKRRNKDQTGLIMIVAKVLKEDGEILKGHNHTVVPEEGDTTISQHGHELIKYDDACFYPEFVVYFRPLNDPA